MPEPRQVQCRPIPVIFDAPGAPGGGVLEQEEEVGGLLDEDGDFLAQE